MHMLRDLLWGGPCEEPCRVDCPVVEFRHGVDPNISKLLCPHLCRNPRVVTFGELGRSGERSQPPLQPLSPMNNRDLPSNLHERAPVNRKANAGNELRLV
jgi:hypothetical protein